MQAGLRKPSSASPGALTLSRPAPVWAAACPLDRVLLKALDSMAPCGILSPVSGVRGGRKGAGEEEGTQEEEVGLQSSLGFRQQTPQMAGEGRLPGLLLTLVWP